MKKHRARLLDGDLAAGGWRKDSRLVVEQMETDGAGKAGSRLIGGSSTRDDPGPGLPEPGAALCGVSCWSLGAHSGTDKSWPVVSRKWKVNKFMDASVDTSGVVAVWW